MNFEIAWYLQIPNFFIYPLHILYFQKTELVCTLFPGTVKIYDTQQYIFLVIQMLPALHTQLSRFDGLRNMNMSCTLLIQLGRHDLKWFFVKELYGGVSTFFNHHLSLVSPKKWAGHQLKMQCASQAPRLGGFSHFLSWSLSMSAANHAQKWSLA